MMNNLKVGIGVAVAGLALSLIPVASAGASVAKSNNPLCRTNKSVSDTEAKQSAAVTKAMQAGNWPAAKKALITSITYSLGQEKAAIKLLSGAPSNVKSAANTVFNYYSSTAEKAVTSSNSLTQYEAKAGAAVGPKEKSAESILTAYSNKVCGTNG